jgi:hypothetical protein
MKTINRNGTYQRVSNEVAAKLVTAGQAKYVPKSEWKANVRDVKVEAVITVKTESPKKDRVKNPKKDARLKAKRKI